MTLACMRLLRALWPTLQWNHFGEPRLYKLGYSRCEDFLESDNRRGFFADILFRWDHEEDYAGMKEMRHVYGAFEIKPQIFSCGAVLRQIAVQKSRLQTWAGSQQHSDGSFVELVVKKEDPLLKMLIEMRERSVMTWDGADKLDRSYPETEGKSK